MARFALRPKRDSEEDVAGLAGWMFADLLLALTVLFLATVSFIPTPVKGDAAVGPLASFTITANTIDLTKMDLNTVKTAMTQYAAQNHISGNFRVGSMSILGGYNPSSETVSQGTQTALKFATAISAMNLPYFQGTSTQIGASAVVSSGHIVLNVNLNGQ